MKRLIPFFFSASITFADRVVELSATANTSATYEVPSGKLVTVLGRNFERTGFCYTASFVRAGDSTNYIDFTEIGNTVAGPATVSFKVFCDGPRQWLLLREWSADPQPAETTPVVPAGSAAVVHLETSSDLAVWTKTISTNVLPAVTNRFWRLKLELVP